MDAATAYMRNSLRHSYLLPTSVALLFLAFGLSSFLMMLPSMQSSDASVLAKLLDEVVKAESDEYLNLNFSQSNISALLAFIACIAISAVIFKYDRSDRHAFMAAYPHVDIKFSEDQRASDSAKAKRYRVAGIAAAVIAVVGFALFYILNLKHIASGIGFCMIAIAVWCVMHASLVMRRYDLFVYNFSALKRTSIYSLSTDQLGNDKDAVIQAKRDSLKSQAINRVVLTASALISFALFVLPTLYTPFYWTPLAVGAIVMAVVAHRALENARRAIDAAHPSADAEPNRNGKTI